MKTDSGVNVMKISKTAVTLLVAGLQLTACAQRAPAPQRLDMHNPATDWCLHVGGKPSQVKSEAGVTGYCTLPSGERIEQWALYHRDHPK